LKADVFLKDGDVLEAGGLKFEIIHTPGHTPGGICIKVGNVVFSGDTLFQASIGRTDFPGGSYRLIIKSIKEKLLTLPDDTVVYPGHGPKTSVDLEKKINPFIN
jgi:hydroxyacylglutathione hydrolase